MIPQNDTEIGKPLFVKTKYSNIVRRRTGVFFCRAKVHGTLVRKSLKTRSIEIAKMKLDKLLEKERARLSKKPSGSYTFADLAAEMMQKIESDPDRKESTKLCRRDNLKMIRKHWPGVDALPASKISFRDCSAWAEKARAAYSPSRFNGQLETLRAVFQEGIDLGAIAENPVVIANKKRGIRGIKRAVVPIRAVPVPTPERFNEILMKLAELSSRRRGHKSVRLLVFSGLRIGAARKLRPDHVNLEKNYIEKPPIKYTDEIKRLPLFDELKTVLKELLDDYPGEGPLMPIANPRKALRGACRDAGAKHLTNHHLRHIFTTRCLESGVDIKTLAEWLDHKDGGALLLKRYAHLIDEHSQRMAKRVKF